MPSYGMPGGWFTPADKSGPDCTHGRAVPGRCLLGDGAAGGWLHAGDAVLAGQK